MDLSSIPTKVLQAEHEAVDPMQTAGEFEWMPRPLCDHSLRDSIVCTSECAIFDECEYLRDDYAGWSERKERYLAELRAAIAERSRLSQLEQGGD